MVDNAQTTANTHKPDLISELLLIPHSWSWNHATPMRSVLLATGASRGELLAVIGTPAKPLEIAGWSISYDPTTDRVRFRREQPPPPRAGQSPAARTMPQVAATRPAPAPLDPQQVGTAARQYQAEQRAEGREISATEAVAHVLERGR